jgi:hypothetical protein
MGSLVASKFRSLEAGYRSAAVLTNKSISHQAVILALLFFDWLDVAKMPRPEVRAK